MNFETARSIWERAVEFLPALKTENSRIISHNVGLRPAREGGPRIELEKINLPFASEHMYGVKGGITEEKEFPVIHIYGFGYVLLYMSNTQQCKTDLLFSEGRATKLHGGRLRKQ